MSEIVGDEDREAGEAEERREDEGLNEVERGVNSRLGGMEVEDKI